MNKSIEKVKESAFETDRRSEIRDVKCDTCGSSAMKVEYDMNPENGHVVNLRALCNECFLNEEETEKPILLCPAGKDGLGRKTYGGTEFSSLLSLHKFLVSAQLENALLVSNGTLYNAGDIDQAISDI
jgi:hypothetical protein